MAKKKIAETVPFDVNAKYIMPFQRKLYHNGVTDDMVCSIEVEKGVVKVKSPDDAHESKYFCIEYFDWLLYTGYIRRYEG